MTTGEASPNTRAQKIVIGLSIVLAVAAIVIELLVILDRLPSWMGTLGGSLIILSLATSVVGRGLGRSRKGDQSR